jgi:hypothetical protein
VDLNSEPVLDRIGQLLSGEGRICGSQLRYELHHLGGQFVAALWAAFVRQQTEASVLLKRGLCLIERGTGKPAGVRRLADGALVDVNLAHPLFWNKG